MPLSVLRGAQSPVDRWGRADGLLAAALVKFEETLCTGCGNPLHESTSADADPDNRDGSHKYVADVPVRCFACTAVAERSKQYEEAKAPQALKFDTERVTRP